ncbi:F-box/LRR-repeat protein 17-like [Curcuma longa]|uniref:F-box/LRR-repeat protein 17-like n=1 Tax=Curcuma longa TaxID=136217 RepID=UPI003D9E219E
MLRHPAATPVGRAPRPKSRGSYNCGHCGLPKKGHVCPTPEAPVPPRSSHRPRRALSFDDECDAEADALALMPVADQQIRGEEEEEELEEEEQVGWGGEWALPTTCMVEVLRRLSPRELTRAAAVCRGWRDCVRRVWRSAEELRICVSPRSEIGSVLRKCHGLTRLRLRMESDVDATLLACVAFSIPNLETFELNMAENAVNRITGDELGRFVADKQFLSSLKIEDCTNIGFLNLTSSSLSTLWLSNLHSISKVAFKCPNLREISLDFARQENDTTDLATMMEYFGRTCPRLKNIHIASIHLSNEVVLALTSANLRNLQMVSLVLGSRITDAAVTAIVSSYTNLELLDLSGSSITDSGLRMICNVFPRTLCRLLLALCQNITSSGIQFAAAKLPLLRLIDCGMSICRVNNQYQYKSRQPTPCPKGEVTGKFARFQKLIIKHANLRKLSLWGCSGLDSLYLNCPELNELNLNSCTNLHPERFLLQCPSLKNVHASGCQEMIIGAIRNQVLNEFVATGNHLPSKRLADGSKRVPVPHFVQQHSEEEKQKRKRLPHCVVHHD